MIWFDEVKNIAYVLKEAWKIDEYSKILELQQQLLDMQNTISELHKDNKDLRDKFDFKWKLIYKNNARYNWEDWPFCSRCWDKNKELIRIISRGINNDYADCPECKNHFNYTWKEKNYNISKRGSVW